MGVYIYTDGDFDFDKPISAEKVAEINKYLEAEHREEGAISPWCDYRIADDGTGIEVHDEEGYNNSLNAEWLKEIIKRLPEGVVVKGEIYFNDSCGEYWTYKIVDNIIYECTGYIAYEEPKEV